MLELVNSISDLKKLDVKQLPQLCAEIRDKLTREVTASGGHLASNLGVVELTVALHYVFDEADKIVWDVGHQSYVHKILTSRGENFSSLRQKGGLSGFPDCDESATDCFNTGHAGTAISAALGLAKARDIAGETHKVIAVVGDGSMTCGTTYEALNNIKDTPMLVVLNDNNMSISQNVGSATLNMSKLRVGKYDKRKEKLKKFLLKVPLLGKPTYRFLRWYKRRYKLRFIRNSFFDNFDLKYIGIIDGNEIKDVIYYLTKIRDNVTKPTVLHVVTKKGKGYQPAEANPEQYHSVPGANAPQVQMESATVVGQTLCDLAEQMSNVVAVCAAMSKAVGFEQFEQKFPQRFFDVGIAEEHAVTFAAGLAKGGAKPFVGIYSTFLQRSYDQILHDVALQNLPVTFLLDRAGFVGEDGKTHQGLFDLSYLTSVPNLQVWAPATYNQLEQMIVASTEQSAPVAIRYSRTLLNEPLGFGGKWQLLQPSNNGVMLVAVGARLAEVALKVALASGAGVALATTVKPLDVDFLDSIGAHTIVTLEENVVQGGFGQSVANYFCGKNGVTVAPLGVRDNFVCHASIAQQMVDTGLDEENVTKFVIQLISKR